MGNSCFAGWLAQEVESAQNALLTRIEQLDTLRYVEAPKLRNEYMVKIGTTEDEVLNAELDAKMLQRKLELIQIKRNRREPIDMAEIDQQIEAERQALLVQAETDDAASQRLPQLTEEQQAELQALYHKIVEGFHPQVHPNLTDTEKALYEKAVDAYRNRNLAALKLIDEILFKDGIAFALKTTLSVVEEDEQQQAAVLAEALSADYTLAKQLYPYFVPQQEDAVLRSAAERYTVRREETEIEIEQLRQAFPFTAQPTLADPEKTKAYLEQLTLRKLRAQDAEKQLTQKLNRIMEELPYA